MASSNSIFVVLFLLFGMVNMVSAGTVYVRKAPPLRKSIVVKPAKPFYNAVWIKGHWGWRNGMHVWVNGDWVKNKKGKVERL